MKLIETIDVNEYGAGTVILEIEGQKSVSFYADPECSEDFTFYRSLNDIFQISELIRLAYEAGKRGEDFEHEIIE